MIVRQRGVGSLGTTGMRLTVALALVACAPGEKASDDGLDAGGAFVSHDTVSGLDVTVRGFRVDSAVAPPAGVPGAAAATAPKSSAPHVTAAPDASLPPGAKLADASPGELAELASRMIIPVQGVVAAALHDTFSERRGGGTRAHEALDIPAPRGTPVLAAVAGRVLKLHKSAAGGLMIYTADESDRFILMYAHLDQYAPGIAEGMPLRKGQVIATVGTTGNAPPGTPHLHFAIARGSPSLQWWRGQPANPFPLLVH